MLALLGFKNVLQEILKTLNPITEYKLQGKETVLKKP
jgi:hypothetical protein